MGGVKIIIAAFTELVARWREAAHAQGWFLKDGGVMFSKGLISESLRRGLDQTVEMWKRPCMSVAGTTTLYSLKQINHGIAYNR